MLAQLTGVNLIILKSFCFIKLNESISYATDE